MATSLEPWKEDSEGEEKRKKSISGTTESTEVWTGKKRILLSEILFLPTFTGTGWHRTGRLLVLSHDR